MIRKGKVALVFKSTTRSGFTGGSDEVKRTKWVPRVWVKKKPVEFPCLCSSDVLHAYTSPDEAIQQDWGSYLSNGGTLWLATGRIVVDHKGGKVGLFELKVIRKINTKDPKQMKVSYWAARYNPDGTPKRCSKCKRCFK